MRDGILFNTQQYARDMERLMYKVYSRYEQGLNADHVTELAHYPYKMKSDTPNAPESLRKCTIQNLIVNFSCCFIYTRLNL